MKSPRTCRFCGRIFRTAAARKSHETKAHRLEIVRKIMQQPVDHFWPTELSGNWRENKAK